MNAAFLGLFTVGEPALPFIDGNALKMAISELDGLFDGAASRSYIKHLEQDWTREPHIRSAYIRDNEDYRIVRALQRPVGERILFAGGCQADGECAQFRLFQIGDHFATQGQRHSLKAPARRKSRFGDLAQVTHALQRTVQPRSTFDHRIVAATTHKHTTRSRQLLCGRLPAQQIKGGYFINRTL